MSVPQLPASPTDPQAARGWCQRLRRGRLYAYLAIAGPGLIAANAGNDAAGIATYSSAGSQFVYRTLFFMVLVTIALVLVQEMSVRLGTYTGKGLAALVREQFSLRWTAFALFCVLLANTGLVVSEFAGIGAAFELVGVSRYLVVPIFAVLIWALVLFGSYRYAERIFLAFSLAFLAYGRRGARTPRLVGRSREPRTAPFRARQGLRVARPRGRGRPALRQLRHQRSHRRRTLRLPTLPRTPLFLGLFTFQVFFGAAVALTPVNLITLLIGTQVLQGVVAPIVLTYILILANRHSVLGEAANKPAFRIAATAAVTAVAAMSLLLVGQTLLGAIGVG